MGFFVQWGTDIDLDDLFMACYGAEQMICCIFHLMELFRLFGFIPKCSNAVQRSQMHC